MRSVSAITLLSAIGAVVNAAPAVERRQKGTTTIPQKAPFQEVDKLPVLASGITKVDLDMTGYEMGYSSESDQYKCHGSCGIVLRISRTTEKCNHPYAQPFVNFCFGTCASLDGFSPYPPATKFKNDCKLQVQARSTTVEQVASTSAEAPASTSSSQPASTTSASVSRPTGSASGSAAPSGSSSSASPSRTSAVPTGTTIPRPSHPSGIASASGTVASTTPRATPTNAGPVTAGAASTSFSVIAAITVATLAIIIA